MNDNLEDLSKKWKSKALHADISKLAWLVGKWRSIDEQIHYPGNMIHYHEELNFTSYGQPLLNYTGLSWNVQTKSPLHQECGYLLMDPKNNKISFMVAHNFGLITLEEGSLYKSQGLSLESVSISRMVSAKEPEPIKMFRIYELENDILKVTLSMKTTNSIIDSHLHAIYKKVQ